MSCCSGYHKAMNRIRYHIPLKDLALQTLSNSSHLVKFKANMSFFTCFLWKLEAMELFSAAILASVNKMAAARSFLGTVSCWLLEDIILTNRCSPDFKKVLVFS